MAEERPGYVAMKALTVLIAIAGVLLGAALIGHFGFVAVGRALFAVGWVGFLAIVGYHLAVVALLGLCWYALVPRVAPAASFIWGRLVRDSGADVLPLSALGGFVMGARAATLLGIPGNVAVASTIVDVTLEVLGQIGYIAVGLAILAGRWPDAAPIGWIFLILPLALIAVMGFIALQKHHLLGAVEDATRRLAKRWIRDMAVPARPLHHEIHDIYARRRCVYVSTVLHFAAWIASSVEAWIALDLMGARLDIGSVIVIESLLYAIRSAAFAVPNAVGVQEGAYLMLGATLGLTPETALALSLLKRGRDLVVGVPTLLVWQFLEGRRLLVRRPE